MAPLYDEHTVFNTSDYLALGADMFGRPLVKAINVSDVFHLRLAFLQFLLWVRDLSLFDF